jgi:hypothetical protein
MNRAALTFALEWFAALALGTFLTLRLTFVSGESFDQRPDLIHPLAFAALALVGLRRALEPRAPRTIPLGVVILALAVAPWIAATAGFASYRLPAERTAWEWCSTAAALLAAASMGKVNRRALIRVLVALAFGQTLVAITQIHVTLPEQRRLFERRDPAFMRQLREGLGIEPGSDHERSFANRLHANDAYGTFGHPNALAGFLLVGLGLTLGGLRRTWPGMGTVRRAIAVGLVAGLVYGLLLARSRSAWGIALGLTIALGVDWSGPIAWLRRRWLAILGSAGLLAVAVVGLIQLRVLDHLILAETGKSFSYRLEWWRGALGVLSESPWIGVGGGNFRDHYLAWKLPFSSEEILDPHHFPLELACSFGLPALAIYLVAMGSAWWRGGRLGPTAITPATTDGPTPAEPLSNGPLARGAVGLGASFGLLWCFAIGSADPSDLIAFGSGLIIAAATMPGRYPDERAVQPSPRRSANPTKAPRGRASSTAPLPPGTAGDSGSPTPRDRTGLVTFLALHGHWLTAGGVGVPGLTFAAWLLPVLVRDDGTRLDDPVGGVAGDTMLSPRSGSGRGAMFGLFLAGLGVAGVTFERQRITAPLQAAAGLGGRAESADPISGTRRSESLAELLHEDADAQASAAAGWEATMNVALARGDRPGALVALDHARRRNGLALALEPRRFGWWRQRAMLEERAADSGLAGGRSPRSAQTLPSSPPTDAGRYDGVAPRFSDHREIPPEPRTAARFAWRGALERYPNSAGLQFEAAESLDRLGFRSEALAGWRRALELDRTPHLDKKLKMPQRARATAMTAESEPGR